MAGILDNKKRVMDVIITSEGRRQMYNGNLILKYASFTDTHTFYQADVASGSADASKRIFLEAASLPIDQITFETDDTGMLLDYEGNGDVNMDDSGRIYSGSTAVYNTGSYSSAFASLANTLLSGTAENFKNLNMIGTKDPFNDDFFDISVYGGNNKIEFEIIGEDITLESTTTMIATPIPDSEQKVGWVNTTEPLFLDWRLSWLDNFKYKMPLIADTASSITVEYLSEADCDALFAEMSVDAQGWYFGGWKVVLDVPGAPGLINVAGSESSPMIIQYAPDPLSGRPGWSFMNESGQEEEWAGYWSSEGGFVAHDDIDSLVVWYWIAIYSCFYGGGKFVNPTGVSEEMSPTGSPDGGVWLPDGDVPLGVYSPLSADIASGVDITTDHIPQTDKFDYSPGGPYVVGDAWDFIENHLSGTWDWTTYGEYERASSFIQGHSNQATGGAGALVSRASTNLNAAIYQSLPMIETDFVKRSRYNNMFMQVFEIPTSSGELLKLEMIDVPEYTVTREDGSITKRKVVFVGKVYIDSYGMPTFINIFTIVFTKDPT